MIAAARAGRKLTHCSAVRIFGAVRRLRYPNSSSSVIGIRRPTSQITCEAVEDVQQAFSEQKPAAYSRGGSAVPLVERQSGVLPPCGKNDADIVQEQIIARRTAMERPAPAEFYCTGHHGSAQHGETGHGPSPGANRGRTARRPARANANRQSAKRVSVPGHACLPGAFSTAGWAQSLTCTSNAACLSAREQRTASSAATRRSRWLSYPSTAARESKLLQGAVSCPEYRFLRRRRYRTPDSGSLLCRYCRFQFRDRWLASAVGLA